MSDTCMAIQKRLDTLPMFKFPFSKRLIPEDGIYFFYEEGEYWGHGGSKERVVHVEAHTKGKLADDLEKHFNEEYPNMHLTKGMYEALSNMDKRRASKGRSERDFIDMLRRRLSFRFIVVDREAEGSELDRYLASVLSECLYCTPSRDWMGNESSDPKVRISGMWRPPKEGRSMTKRELDLFERYLEMTYRWLERKGILAPVLNY